MPLENVKLLQLRTLNLRIGETVKIPKLVFLFVGVLVVVGGLSSAVAEENSDQQMEAWAKYFMQKELVIDTHSDTLMLVVNDAYDLSERHEEHHIDIPRLIEGGVNGQFFACFIYPQDDDPDYIKNTLDMIDAFHLAQTKDDRLVFAKGADDILQAKQQNRIAGILAIEGGHAIEDDLAVLRVFHRLGVRYMTLTWMNNNNWADASGPDQSRYGDIPDHNGLTDFGRDVIREMNRLGMIVDISHVSDKTFWDVLEVTDKPVFASHSCAWALNPHYRNLKDDMLKALAKNGGVVGINFAAGFLSKEFDDATTPRRKEAMAKYEELKKQYEGNPEGFKHARAELWADYRKGLPPVPLAVLADHIEHVVKVAGIDHVGLGSDFDGIGAAPEGLDDATDLFRIIVELKTREWSDEDLRKLLGLNTLRVIRENIGH